jgi:hypothetical protein
MVAEAPASLDFEPNPGAQRDFVYSQATFPAFVGGFGAGKTAAGCLKVMGYTLQNPGANGCITEPVSGMLADPLMEAWRKLYGPVEGSLWIEQGRLGPNWRLVFPSLKSHILLRSAETPGRLIGFEAAWGWMDEAAETEGGSQEEAFKNLFARLRQTGFRHWLGITTTSAGRDWIWRDWLDDPKPGHVLYKATSYDNPHRDELALAALSDLYVEGTPRHRQRIMAEFAQLEGLVLPGFDPDTMIDPWPENEVFLGSVAGVDFGAQSPTTINEVAITRSRHLWEREWLYKRECDDEEFIRACSDARDAGVRLFVCDPSGRERIQWMQQQGIPAVKAHSNKIEDRVKAWATPISQGRYHLDSASQWTIREVCGLSWAKRRGRELETDRFDPNTPDHAFDAGAYAKMETEKMVLDWKPPTVTENF